MLFRIICGSWMISVLILNGSCDLAVACDRSPVENQPLALVCGKDENHQNQDCCDRTILHHHRIFFAPQWLQDHGVQIHHDLTVVNDVYQTTQAIAKGQVLMHIPATSDEEFRLFMTVQDAQETSSRALRLFFQSNPTLPATVILALRLLHEQVIGRSSTSSSSSSPWQVFLDHAWTTTTTTDDDDDDLAHHHVLFWSPEELERRLGGSHVYRVLRKRQQGVAEYYHVLFRPVTAGGVFRPDEFTLGAFQLAMILAWKYTIKVVDPVTGVSTQLMLPMVLDHVVSSFSTSSSTLFARGGRGDDASQPLVEFQWTTPRSAVTFVAVRDYRAHERIQVHPYLYHTREHNQDVHVMEFLNRGRLDASWFLDFSDDGNQHREYSSESLQYSFPLAIELNQEDPFFELKHKILQTHLRNMSHQVYYLTLGRREEEESGPPVSRDMLMSLRIKLLDAKDLMKHPAILKGTYRSLENEFSVYRSIVQTCVVLLQQYPEKEEHVDRSPYLHLDRGRKTDPRQKKDLVWAQLLALVEMERKVLIATREWIYLTWQELLLEKESTLTAQA